MIEIPEAMVLARQTAELLGGKTITGIAAGTTPHKFTWFYGDPTGYGDLLLGRKLDAARAVGGFVRLEAGGTELVFGEGIELRYLAPQDQRPGRHQLFLEFDDGSALIACTRMYGGMGAFPAGTLDNPYYRGACTKPHPLDTAFDSSYFDAQIAPPSLNKKSIKFVLATEQRIPGFGNGVLQDILFECGIHPKRPLGDLGTAERNQLFGTIKTLLRTMADQGGRSTDKDLLGSPGGYRCKLCAATSGSPCPICGDTINKAAYLGGSIYWCPTCQPL